MKDLCIVIGECRFDWLIVAESPHVADKVCKLFVQFVGHVTWASYNIALFSVVKITLFQIFSICDWGIVI